MIYAQGAVGTACPGGLTGATAVGITFGAPTGYQNATGGTFLPVQLISSDVVNGSSHTAGLDTNIPYAGGKLPSNDNPSVPLSAASNPLTRTFNANMFLMWQSNQAGSILVPLGYQTWGFNATATCGSNCGTAGSWTVSASQAGPIGSFTASSPSQPSPLGNNVLVDGIPTWNGVAH